MFTKSSTKIAAAAALLAPLMLAAPLSAQSAQFRGGGHVSNFQNCMGWGPDGNSVTARAFLSEDTTVFSILSPSFAGSWQNFGEEDEDGWMTADAGYIFANALITENLVRVISIFPPDTDPSTPRFNIRAEVQGFSGQPDCTAEIRLIMRRQQN